MRLPVPFLQLPVRFDAGRLRAEMLALGDEAWREHPSKYPGNYSLPLIAVDGDSDSDEVAGPMLPTPYLTCCPYLMRVLERLGAVWGRTRLMKLAGGAEVTPHVDINYYWREHIRVHVPIQTTPGVRFVCGDAEVNMQAGECWIFDTWRPHRVINAAADERVHLVADTIGGDGFWRIADRARVPGQPASPWPVEDFTPDSPAASDRPLLFEQFNVPIVMSPWELREHLQFIFPYVKPDPKLGAVQQAASRFAANWHARWARFGDTREGWASFASLRDEFDGWLGRNAESLQLTNGMPFVRTLRAMVLKAAVTGHDHGAGASVAAKPPAQPEATSIRGARDGDEFDRPIFIVCPPRSGSSLLFETLSSSPDVCTLGNESHRMIEVETAGGSLGAIARGYGSNRLDAADAAPAIAEELRARYRDRVFDREGKRRSGAIRLLEKTPKNALRIPFLSAVFPDAVFVYLYRDPRAVMASMLEAWESGRFRTYPDLPGWTGLPWSMVLVPGWRELIGRPLPEVVAAQWSITTRTLLDDLEKLPRERVHALRYEALLAGPDVQIRSLCSVLGLRWDRTLDSGLPLARYTVTPPTPDKWRKRESEILPQVPQLVDVQARAERLLLDWEAPMAIAPTA
ncbi:MAG TPA: sulfotransferase [Rhodanobacteraceae bacterium]|nr:sulfotransferase [Rhodanobacteraceae bacterium]